MGGSNEENEKYASLELSCIHTDINVLQIR